MKGQLLSVARAVACHNQNTWLGEFFLHQTFTDWHFAEVEVADKIERLFIRRGRDTRGPGKKAKASVPDCRNSGLMAVATGNVVVVFPNWMNTY